MPWVHHHWVNAAGFDAFLLDILIATERTPMIHYVAGGC